MKHEQIVDGEAMSAVEGIDASHLNGTHMVIDLQQEPQRAAFNAYRVAFRDNANDPNLAHAAALVAAWNGLCRHFGGRPDMSATTPPVVAVPNQDEITIDQTDDYIVVHQHDSTGAGDADIYVHRRNLGLFIAALLALEDGQEA